MHSNSIYRFTITSSHTTNDDLLKDWAEVRSVTTDLLDELNVKVGDRARVLLKGFISVFSLFGNILLQFFSLEKSILPNYPVPCVCVSCVCVFNLFGTNVRREISLNFQKHERRTRHSVRVCCWPIRRCRRKLSTDRSQRYLIPTNFSPKLMLAFEWR